MDILTVPQAVFTITGNSDNMSGMVKGRCLSTKAATYGQVNGT